MTPDPATAPPSDLPTRPPTEAASVGDVPTVTGEVPPGGMDTLTRPAAPAGGFDPPPGFAVERELGVGGMGAVFLATQAGLNRPVALKLMRAGERADPKALIRFLAEAEAVAAVKHPNVVEVYAYGDHHGRPYLVLEYCPGGDLTALATGQPMRDAAWFRRVAGLMAGVADGVNAAHSQGIVHRDLKPGNVLLAADGMPKVADFGLAKRGTGSDLTRTQAVMGTPAYMAPEQAKGEAKFVGPEADVWALGVMLYELCCGERPVGDGGGNMMEVLARVATAQVPPLRSKCPAVPPDLALVAHKCLSKDPRDRYPTAGGLASDLRNWLDGRPISVRPAGVVERSLKWVRRNPTLSGVYVASAATVFLVGIAVALGWLWWRADFDRRSAEEARRQAAEARDEVGSERDKLARFEYGRTIQVAHQAWLDDNPLEAETILGRTDPRLRGWEWHHLRRLCHSELFEEADVATAAVSAAAPRLAAVRADGTLSVRDTRSGSALLHLRGSPGDGRFARITYAVLSRGGERLLTRDARGHVQVWGVPGGEPLGRVQYGGAAPQFTADGKRVVTADDKEVAVWDADSGRKLAVLGKPPKDQRQAAANRDGSRVAVPAGDEFDWRLWDTAGPGELGSIRSAWFEARFSDDGNALLAFDTDDFTENVITTRAGGTVISEKRYRSPKPGGDVRVSLRDPATGAVRSQVVLGKEPRWVALGVSPDARWLAAGVTDHTVRLHDLSRPAAARVLSGHAGVIRAVAFSPDGRRVATASEDATARVWDVETGKQLHLVKCGDRPFEGVAFAGEHGLAAFAKDHLGVWDLRTLGTHRSADLPAPPDPECEFERAGRRGKVSVFGGTWFQTAHTGDGFPNDRKPNCVVFSADGKWAAVGFSDGQLLLWDRVAGKAVSLFPAGGLGMGDGKPLVAFSPDGTRLVCLTQDEKTARVLDSATGGEVCTLSGHQSGIVAAAFTPDGSRVATAGREGGIRVWDAATGGDLASLDGHRGRIGVLAFDAGGARLAGGGVEGDPTIRVWEVATGRSVVMTGHVGAIASVAFHPDGSRLTSAATDGSVRLWDVTSGAEVFTLKRVAAKDKYLGVRFSGDGRQLMANTGSGYSVWDSAPVRSPE